MSEVLEADDFTVGSTANITNIRFWTIQSAGSDYVGSVYWAVYTSTLGSPGIVLQSSTATVTETATGNQTAFFYPEFVIDIPVAFQLAPGTYWLALHNGPLTTTASAEVYWSTTNPGNGTAGKYTALPLAGSPTWISTDQEHAFRIDGDAVTDTPEPGSVLLVGSALAFAALRTRQRRNIS